MSCRVENIVDKGEIACYKQFLLFSQGFPKLYIFSASKCDIVWLWVNIVSQGPENQWFFWKELCYIYQGYNFFYKYGRKAVCLYTQPKWKVPIL